MTSRISIALALRDLWADMSGSQKWVTCSLIVLAIGALFYGGWDSFTAHQEVRVYERQAAEAAREEDAKDLASKVASKLQIAEQQLSKVEDQRNVQKNEITKGADVISRDRAEYERAVHERLPTVPSTDVLCKQLADAGHPCYPIANP